MFDPNDIPLETAEGRRPSSTAGDRLMVGLAALALIGGALIAVGKFLPQSDSPETSEATATVEPTVEASRTPRPTPTPPPLRSFRVAPGSPILPIEESLYSGWVRALEDVTFWSSADDPNATPVGILAAGEAAWVHDIPEDQGGTSGWFEVETPARGWIPAEVEGRVVLRLFPWSDQGAGWIDGLVAGPTGFVAHVARPGDEAEFDQVLATSADGRTWNTAEADFLRGFYGSFLAHGPAGWLAIADAGGSSFGPTPWIWRSADLSAWEPLGQIGDAAQDGGFSQLVGTESGYVLVSYGSGRSSNISLWYSTDGELWSERRAPGLVDDGYGVQVTATPLGFYAYGQPGFGSSSGAYSPDGWSWSSVDAEELANLLGVAAAGESLVAIDQPPGGDAKSFVGNILGEQLSWTQDDAGSAFEGAVVTLIVSDGEVPIAFGWERGTEIPLWWERTDGAWQRHRLPTDYQGIPRGAAAGPAGYLLLEMQPTTFGENPVLWHNSGAGGWLPADDVVGRPPDPSDEDCASLSGDVIELITSTRLHIACNGDADVRFRAFLQPCVGCYYFIGEHAAPPWLARTRTMLNLLPTAAEGWQNLSAVLSPSLEFRQGWDGGWLDVTGHFDDPAATRCQSNPTPDEERWYGGRQSIVDQCRQRFVITRVRVIPAEE